MSDLIERLQQKKMTLTEIPHWGIYFKKRWEDCFVSHLNQAEKEAIYLYKYGYL